MSDYKILLVEDDPAHAALIQRVFAEYMALFELTIVHTLSQAQAWLDSHTPDLVFTDFSLPDGDGMALLNKDGLPYPVVVLTSHGNESIAIESLKAGALDYVMKSPTVFNDMPHTARRMLRQWSLMQERKNTERDLRDSEEKFRKILEATHEGILLVDVSGNIVLANAGMERLFGYTREELLGQPVETLIPPAIREEHIRLRQSYTLNPHARLMGGGSELEAARKDGSIFPAEISLTPLHMGAETLMMCFIADVTLRRQLEENRLYARALEIELEKEREIIELKERFTSMVSHEFRTPLTVILSSVSIVQSYFDKLGMDTILKHMDRVSKQVERMVRMLDNVLAISRNNAGHTEFNPEPLNIIPFCQGLLETARLIDHGEHRFIFKPNGTALTVLADPVLLEHVFSNLLSNAVKYSPAGTTITLTVNQTPQEVIFKVKDQGIGIPANDQTRLFQAFHRAENVGGINGTGLGLVVVKQNVEAHGGDISFHSEEGQGTTFTVRLPYQPS